MESYYSAKLDPRETSTMKAMSNIWRTKHPGERNYLDANKLATVRRYIEWNQMPSNDKLKEIEAKVKENLKTPNVEQEQSLGKVHDLGTTGLVNNTETGVDMNNTPNYNNNYEDEQMIIEIKENILRKWEVLKEKCMAERSVLPKIMADKKLKKIMEQINKAMEQIELSDLNLNLTELNQLIYAAASAITKQIFFTKMFQFMTDIEQQ